MPIFRTQFRGADPILSDRQVLRVAQRSHGQRRFEFGLKYLAHLRSALRCMHGTNIGTAVPTGKYQVPATMYLKVPER